MSQLLAIESEELMTEYTDGFVQLCKKLVAIDLFGDGPLTPPWGDPPTLANVKVAIETGASFLPNAYRAGYATSLLENLSSVINTDSDTIETLAGAVYDHASGSTVKPELQRFVAVITNLYPSFLSNSNRVPIEVP